jgi:hypothetical protein
MTSGSAGYLSRPSQSWLADVVGDEIEHGIEAVGDAVGAVADKAVDVIKPGSGGR